MDARLLLATDLDGTLLPNGDAPESPGARDRFARLVARRDVVLAYVTGRDQARVEQAMAQYALPTPDFVIADVGASLYRVTPTGWERQSAWDAVVADDWAGRSPAAIAEVLSPVPDLYPQETDRQGRWKLSFYAPAMRDPAPLLMAVRARLAGLGVAVRLVWSLDATAGVGLLDILPVSAGKQGALAFLLRRLELPDERSLFSGDSGNDLEVLAGPMPAVLVANASAEIRDQAMALARSRGHAERLYLARGGWSGLNGNYSAGILEGLAHFHPETVARDASGQEVV